MTMEEIKTEYSIAAISCLAQFRSGLTGMETEYQHLMKSFPFRALVSLESTCAPFLVQWQSASGLSLVLGRS